MRTVMLAAVAAMLSLPAGAQTPPVQTYVAKPGDTIDLGPIYWASSITCQNAATAKSEVEILTGPPGLAVEVREAMVVPAYAGCKSAVKGGHVWLTVPFDIEGAQAHVVTRITHHDKNGANTRGFAFNLLIAH